MDTLLVIVSGKGRAGLEAVPWGSGYSPLPKWSSGCPEPNGVMLFQPSARTLGIEKDEGWGIFISGVCDGGR